MRALLLLTALLSSPALAATWDCAHANPVAPNNVRSLIIQGTQRVPAAAQLVNARGGAVLAQTRRLSPRPGYQGGYWSQNYGLDSYWIADQNGVRYVLLTPHGVLGAQFTAQVHENFAVGGSLQNEFLCVQR